MAEAASNENSQGMHQGQFAIQKIYTKDISFETPNSPKIFSQQWNPSADVQMQQTSESIGEDVYEVVLSVTVTVKVADTTAFLVEVKQAGIFGIKGIPEQQLSQVLGAFCPNILFPYAREAISDLITRGGFPQLLLAPVNFDALYMQQMQQQAGGAGTPMQ